MGTNHNSQRAEAATLEVTGETESWGAMLHEAVVSAGMVEASAAKAYSAYAEVALVEGWTETATYRGQRVGPRKRRKLRDRWHAAHRRWISDEVRQHLTQAPPPFPRDQVAALLGRAETWCPLTILETDAYTKFVVFAEAFLLRSGDKTRARDRAAKNACEEWLTAHRRIVIHKLKDLAARVGITITLSEAPPVVFRY